MKLALFAVLLLPMIASPVSRAEPSNADYLAALKIAQQKVERVRSVNTAQPGALSSSLLLRLMGRYYQVGDRWQVAAWTLSNPTSRMTDDPIHLKTSVRKAGLFQYEVTQVKPGPDPQVIIEVTQLNSMGMKAVDSKVQKLTLTMNDKMNQSAKAYTLQGNSTPVPVPPEGMRTSLTELELFPLDVPELLTAVEQTPTAFPELPGAVQSFAKQHGITANLGQSLWYEQDDYFGRPIQALWEHGNPWPTYFKTVNGVALLVSRDLR